MPPRFYCPNLAQTSSPRLEGDEARHLSRACRIGPGELVELFDGHGLVHTAQVIAIDNKGVDIALLGQPLPERATLLPLVLAVAVPKSDRFDWLVEKATELGVSRLIPLIAERSVVDPRGQKLERLRRAIVEASKQCRRDRLMILERPTPWAEVARSFAESIKFLADPQGARACEWPLIPPGHPAILAVGPEGGFTVSERESAVQWAWQPISLSANILRIETAALAGSAALLVRGHDTAHIHTVH